MKVFESRPSRRIKFTIDGGGIEASADIVDELPQLGDTYDGRTVLEVRPNPLTWMEQKNMEIFNYSIWKLHLEGNEWRYVAVHEPESDTM